MELLADGEWADFAQILAKVMVEVESPKAIRRAENARVNALPEGSKDQPRQRSKGEWELAEIGARDIACELLLKGRRFEVQWMDAEGQWTSDARSAPKGTRRRIRLDPTYVYGSKETPRRKAEEPKTEDDA